MSKNARPSGCAKLAGEPDLYRIRVGDYRIIYQVNDPKLTVLVLSIAHRREIYRQWNTFASGVIRKKLHFVFVVATALCATPTRHVVVERRRKLGEGGCAVQLFTPAPHSSDRPQAGGYTGKPAREFSSGWFVVGPVASVAKFFTIESREKNRNFVETGVR